MSETRKAVTTILTVEMNGKNYLLLNATDPRWRLDARGRYQNIPALGKDGAAARLPLSGLKFIGGLVDGEETPEQAARRELSEEAGAGLGRLIGRNGLKPVYRMTRHAERDPGVKMEIAYYHAHIKIGKDAFARLVEPRDDCLALVLVAADQIVEDGKCTRICGSAQSVFYRPAYAEIPYAKGSIVTTAMKQAFDFYNRHGPSDPFVGIDRASLENISVPLYTPSGIAPSARLTARQIAEKAGGPVPDGAIFMQLVKPTLKPPAASPPSAPQAKP